MSVILFYFYYYKLNNSGINLRELNQLYLVHEILEQVLA